MTEAYKSTLSLDVSGWKQAAQEAKAAIAEVKAALVEMRDAANQAAPPAVVNQAAQAARDTANAVNQAAKEIQDTGAALNQAGQDAAEAATAFDSVEIAPMIDRLKECASEVHNFREALQFVKDVGKGVFLGVKDAIDEYREEQRKMREEAQETGETIKKSAEKGAQGMRLLASSARASGSSFSSSALTIAKAMVGVRSLYALIRRLRSAFVSGIKELSNYSTEVKDSLGQMSAAMSQLQNSIGAAFAPLVTVAAPYITAFISHIAEAFNAVGAFFAALTGQSSYTRAVYNYKGISDAASDAASSAHSAAAAQEELNRQLMGFDEINQLKPTGGGGGSGGSGGGGGSSGSAGNGLSFVTESIPNTISDVAQYLRGLFSDIDLGPLKTQFDNLKTALGGLADVIKEGLKWGLENVLKPLAKWYIEDAGPKQLRVLAEAVELVTGAVKLLKPVGGWLWENFLKPLAESLGKLYTDNLEGLANLLEDINGCISDIQEVVNGNKTLGEMLKSWFTVDNLTDFSIDLADVLEQMQLLLAFVKNPVQMSIVLLTDQFQEYINSFITYLNNLKIDLNPFDGNGISIKEGISLKAAIEGEITKTSDKTNGTGVVRNATAEASKLRDGTGGGGVINNVTANAPKVTVANRDVNISAKTQKVGWTSDATKSMGVSALTEAVKWADNAAKNITVGARTEAVKWVKKGADKNLSVNAKASSISVKNKLVSGIKATISEIKLSGKAKTVYDKLFTKAKGGIYQNGRWSNIPQYAGGTLNAGTMFVAGEAGPEVVGHIGGRTEVLNQSQIASAIYSAVVAAMGQRSQQPTTVQVTLDGRVIAESTLNQFRGMVREGRDPLAGVV